MVGGSRAKGAFVFFVIHCVFHLHTHREHTRRRRRGEKHPPRLPRLAHYSRPPRREKSSSSSRTDRERDGGCQYHVQRLAQQRALQSPLLRSARCGRSKRGRRHPKAARRIHRPSAHPSSRLPQARRRRQLRQGCGVATSRHRSVSHPPNARLPFSRPRARSSVFFSVFSRHHFFPLFFSIDLDLSCNAKAKGGRAPTHPPASSSRY